MTCVNQGKEPWASSANPLLPVSCDGGEDGELVPICPEIDPDPAGCIGWEPGAGECPAAPLNVEVVSPLFAGALDLRWDPPAIQAKNSKFAIVGVNIYRSFSSERGPYHRVNAAPVGGVFYRDFTDNALVENEVVDWNFSWLSRGEQANSRTWRFRTSSIPITKKEGQGIAANSPSDVLLTIDDEQLPVNAVFGPTGEITLINTRGFDFASERWVEPILPTGPETAVSITYYYSRGVLRTDLDHKVWYRLTTVAADPSSATGYRETPLDYSEPVTFRAVERIDYIWQEAMRRNNWILEQGGERVKVFIRKTSGRRCYCGRDPRTLEYAQQPDARCLVCFGTGIVGGYEGPYDIIISPDDNDRSVQQTPNGRHMDHMQDVWTGVSPLLTQRDFIVKLTNERYSIGPVRKPSNRGNLLQQHFGIRYLDEQDIRYQVPLFDTTLLCWPDTRLRPALMQGGAWLPELPPLGPYPVGANYQQTPLQTEKENIPDEREQRGRTPVYENLTY